MALVVWGLAAGVALVYRDVRTSSPYPKKWDSRVAPLASFVEQKRGWKFVHPIEVQFLTDQQYVAYFTHPATAPTASEVAKARQMSELLDAMGLAANYDALEGQATMQSVSTLGFYSQREHRIVVRGSVLTPAVRVVLVHELTHALQAQHFTIRLGGSNDSAVRAVTEADAMRVEDLYRARLSPTEKAQESKANSANAATDKALSSVPWAVVTFQNAPYALGPLLVHDVAKRSGNPGVDGLLNRPPTEKELLSPWTYGHTPADIHVPVRAPKGATVVEPAAPWSILDTLVMLDAWLPWSMARGALDGWIGASSVLYRTSATGPLCFTASVAFDGSPRRFADAITWWSGASGRTTTSKVGPHHVTFDTCARGAKATAPKRPVVSPIDAIALESIMVPDHLDPFVTGGAEHYQCVARAIIDNQATAPLLAKAHLSKNDEATLHWVSGAAAKGCGLAVKR